MFQFYLRRDGPKPHLKVQHTTAHPGDQLQILVIECQLVYFLFLDRKTLMKFDFFRKQILQQSDRLGARQNLPLQENLHTATN